MLERSHLQIISLLAQHKTLAEVANAMSLTQSALSHAIKKLEEYHHCKLWVREGRNLQLTQAGQYLLQVSQQLLPQLEHAEQTIAAYGAGKHGRLRIGMECHPCYEWLLNVVRPFLKKWEDVELDVLQRFRFDGYEALKQYNIDMLITSDLVHAPHLAYEPMLDYELMLVTNKQHPLLSKPFIGAEDLQAQTIITFPVSKDRLDIFTQFLLPAGIEPQQQQTTEEIEIMLELVAANKGVCALPGWLYKKYQGAYPIKAMPLGRQGINKTLYLVFRKQDAEIEYLQDFCLLGKKCLL